MADIQYLNYGDLQIELLAFLDKAKKEVYNYVRKLPWSTKRKERFMSAYSDIMTRGVLGASIDDKTGLYKIQVGGDVMNISPDDLKIYGDAAAYLLELMESLPTKASLEEEAKKKAEEEKAKLPIFDNEYFKTNFINHLSKNEFGGSKLFDTQNDWNGLDKRNEKTGLRGREERARILARNLQSYADSLDETKLNFEGSPFENLLDFKDRINKAVYALTETPDNIDDDNETLRRIGIRASDWFNNGSGDPSGLYIDLGDGTKRELTYGELAQHNLEQENKKLAALKQTAYDNKLFFNRVTSPKMLGRSSVELKEKYKDSNSLLTALLGYAQQDIRTLTPDEISEVHGAYRNLAKVPIDSKLLSQLQNSANGLYVGSSPNRFKKINGIDNLIWDSHFLQVIQINNRQLQQALLNQPTDLFKGVLTLLDILNNYMNSTEGGFTPAELREVAALLFDLGAAVDPEGFSSAGLSQIAAGIRDYNRASDPEGWTWGDTGWAALDHGLGLLSAIPVVGGLVKGSWAAAKLGNYIPKMEKWIRLAGRAGSTYAMAANAPGALNTLNKIKNGEDLSLKDYLDLAYFFIGGLGHHQLNRGNRVERSAMKARGIETSNSLLNKAGITRTKAKTTSSTKTTPTLKVLKTGENGKVETKEIPINEKLLKALNKTKTEDLETKAKELEIKIPEGYKILPKSTTTKTWSRENLNRYRGKAHSEIFGTQALQKLTSGLKPDEEFEQYLSEHNNTWLKKFFNGSNKDIRRYDRYLGNNNQISKPSEKTPKVTETPKTTKAKPLTSKEIKELKENIKEFNKYTEGTAKHSGNHLSEEPFKAGDFDFEVSKFPNSSAGNIDISFNGKVMKSISFDNLKDMMKKVANFLKENRKLKDTSGALIKKFNAEKMGEILKQLKAKGVFKQGGRIDKLKIQKYKNFINK